MNIDRKSFLKTMTGAMGIAALYDISLPSLAIAQEKARVPSKSTRIRDIEMFPYALTMKEEIKIAIGTDIAADNILVRLRTEDGVVGYGEASPYAPVTGETQASDIAIGRSLAPFIKGKDAFSLTRIISDMESFTPGNSSIKAAFETALWDVCGKVAGQPICNLLGCYRDSFETDMTVGMDPPEVMAEKARGIVQRGFRAVKIKVGIDPAKDIERIQAVRAAIGPKIKLRIDANQGWSPAECVQVLRGVVEQQLQFCEQPVPYWDWAGLRFIRDSVSTPIMVDESVHVAHDAIVGIRERAMDMINIKLMKCGGILQAVRIAQVADAANIKCMLGCMDESRLGLTAAAHVVASQKNVEFADLDAFLFLDTDPVIAGMELRDGVLYMPKGPGLGLDVDPGFIAKLKAA
jgi:L-alanine-DL-glutamate epimerase-like enolase superfamily enzyme